MAHFYGIIDKHGLDHSTRGHAIERIRKKFPVRTASFEHINRGFLQLFGKDIRSASGGGTQLFLIGDIYDIGEVYDRTSRKEEDVLLDLFMQHGEAAFAKLNGSFVIIILDSENHSRCRIYNDQMGTIQVFYFIGRDYILFASELKYLFCDRSCPREIDWQAALKRPIPFLIVNAERHYDAWFKDIHLLEEGSVIDKSYPSQSNPGPVTIRQYWDPWKTATDPTLGLGLKTEESKVEMYCEAYMDLLDDAVRLQTSSPGSAFSMFSGGMDSSVLAALARKYGEVDTFSFATQATLRDGATVMCIRLAKDLDVANTQIVIPFDHLVMNGELWTKHIWSMESPMAHKDAIGKMALHAAVNIVQPGVKHIMSGTGSDQINGGLVRWFIENADDESHDENWDRVMTEIRTEMLKPVIGHQYDTFWGSRDLLRHDFFSSISQSPLDPYPWPDFVRGCLHANQYILVWDELRAGAWHDRGVRFPFMDHRFVPFVLSVPRELHHRLFFDKQILRRGAKSILPDYLTNRPKAPVQKPGEDKRMSMYKEILLGQNGLVLDMLMEAMNNKNIPVDRDVFESKVRKLSEEPDQAGWAYLMHIAGLVLLDQLPDQDESSMDMHGLIMPHIDIVKSTAPSVIDNMRNKLAVLTHADLMQLPVSFSPSCSLVSDVFSGVHFLVKDGEMSYELDDDCPEWRTFLLHIDGVKSAHEICIEEDLDPETFGEYFRTSLEEGILYTMTSPVQHAST